MSGQVKRSSFVASAHAMHDLSMIIFGRILLDLLIKKIPNQLVVVHFSLYVVECDQYTPRSHPESYTLVSNNRTQIS